MYKFNDGMGNRSRKCRVCVVHDGKAFSQADAVKDNLAVFKQLKYHKNGKWSSSDWEVAVNSARLIVYMSPFDGWSDSLEDCLLHVVAECKKYIGYTPTREEAEIAFKFGTPTQYARVTELTNAECALV